MNTSEILRDARAVLDDTIQLRRRIHRQPEVGLSVPRTQATVLEALEGLGLDVRTGQRTTSIVARLTGARPGPTILLRADMDALPMAEEGYHGARVMIEEGLLDGAAAPSGAFALHVTHRMAAGSISARAGAAMASGDTLQIVVRGKGGHASAPHDCLDPI